jgi:CheY-like chemotaxis protein
MTKSHDENETTNEFKGSVLVMDDEQPIRMIAGEMLYRIGFRVEVASTGEEAVALYRRERESGKPFDAVILDINIIGGMGGKETIKMLREIEPNVKAIVSSGSRDSVLMTDFRRYGFSAVLPKPYGIEELTDTLRKVILYKAAILPGNIKAVDHG